MSGEIARAPIRIIFANLRFFVPSNDMGLISYKKLGKIRDGFLKYACHYVSAYAPLAGQTRAFLHIGESLYYVILIN